MRHLIIILMKFIGLQQQQVQHQRKLQQWKMLQKEYYLQ